MAYPFYHFVPPYIPQSLEDINWLASNYYPKLKEQLAVILNPNAIRMQVGDYYIFPQMPHYYPFAWGWTSPTALFNGLPEDIINALTNVLNPFAQGKENIEKTIGGWTKTAEETEATFMLLQALLAVGVVWGAKKVITWENTEKSLKIATLLKGLA